MAKTSSMTRNHNYNNDGVAPWADLNHDMLSLVMMKLGVIHFVSFGRVCKSWRSLALSNKNKFMASKPPMSISIENHAYKKESYCYIEDFEGRMFKTLLPDFSDRTCVGLTCGYLILFGGETKDFWLVNPITSHHLHFPTFPFSLEHVHHSKIKDILVFSPSSGWLFVITKTNCHKVWFSIAGKGVWNHVHVPTTSNIFDLDVVKGKIYTLNMDYRTGDVNHLYEMRLGLEPNLMLLETKNFPKIKGYPHIVSLDENLHLFEYISEDSYKVHQLDFGEMKWVYREKTNEEYAFYTNKMNYKTNAVKRESCNKSRKGRPNYADLWYFPHDCLNVNHIDDC